MTEHIVTIYYNGEEVLHVARPQRLPGRQRQIFDSMDEDMRGGITLHGKSIQQPGPVQRAEYVTGELLRALVRNRPKLAELMGSYLANRLPDLNAIRVEKTARGVRAQMEFAGQ